MRVCHIVPSLEERHGGPSRSVRALADAVAAAGTETALLTTLEPGQAMAPPGSGRARVEVFPREAPRWLCRSPGLAGHLARTPYDCYHAHALWLLPLDYARGAAARHDAPLVIAPRGMMSGWAWRHRRGRKWLAERLVHPGAFAAAAGWHATSPEEADDIRGLGFRQPVCVAPNGVELPDAAELAAARAHWLGAVPALRGRRVAVFYSRFHRKKRVLELLDLWRARPRDDWFLLLVGIAEEHSAEELGARIGAAGLADRAAAVEGAGHPPPYAAAEVFLLPSHSENFGLVVAEALAAGVPALVTDGTPWRGLEERGAGWCRAWETWPAVMDAALKESPEVLAARGRAGRAWVAAEFTWQRSAGRLLEFYAHLRER